MSWSWRYLGQSELKLFHCQIFLTHLQLQTQSFSNFSPLFILLKENYCSDVVIIHISANKFDQYVISRRKKHRRSSKH